MIPSLSSYPNGFGPGVMDRGLPILTAFTGKTFWVNSNGGSNGNRGTTRDRPFATLDYAFGLCTGGQGDVILVAPNHSETITGAGGIAHDVSNVAVLGLGRGTSRPTFLMDGGTAVTYAITAANALVSGLKFKSGHSNVVAGITTTKAGTWIDDCMFENNTTNEDFLTCIKATSTTDNDSDYLRVSRCRWMTSDADDLEFIEINANIAGFVCEDNYVQTAGTASPMVLCATGKLLTGALIRRCVLQNKMTANELFFSNDGSTNTGVAHDIYVGHRDVTTTHDVGLESSGLDLFNIWSTSTAALQGGVIPAADVNN